MEKMKERKGAKLKIESTRSERLKQRRRKEVKEGEVKRNASDNKRNRMKERAVAAERRL